MPAEAAPTTQIIQVCAHRLAAILASLAAPITADTRGSPLPAVTVCDETSAPSRLLLTSSLPQLPAALSSLLLLLAPAGTLVLAPIVLGQPASLIQIAGAVLVCGGVLVVARSQDKDHADSVGSDMAPEVAHPE